MHHSLLLDSEEMEKADAAPARWKDVPGRALKYRRILDRLGDAFSEQRPSDPRADMVRSTEQHGR